MRVLVTGGSGFIGTNLVEHFANAGHQVINVDVVTPRNAAHNILWNACDVRDSRAIGEIFQAFSPEIVLHFAARTDLLGKSLDEYSSNIAGVENIVEHAARLKNPPFCVFASSMLVCQLGYIPKREDDYCPSNHYGRSKVIGETIVRRMHGRLPWVILRPTSIWGPWFDVPYRDFFETVRRGLYVHPKKIPIKRTYGFVLNSVHQVAALVKTAGGSSLHRTLYMADETVLDLRDWATRISEALDAPPVREVPVSALRVIAKFGDLAQSLGLSRVPLSTFRLNNLMTTAIYDTTPIHDISGGDPYSIEEGISLTCRWLLDHPRVK